MSRAEIVLISGILMLVFSILFPLGWGMKLQRIKNIAREDVSRIENACIAFQKQYGRLPSRLDIYYDFHYGLPNDLPNSEVIEELRGTKDAQINSNRIEFLILADAQSMQSGLNAHGDFVDPWASPYQIVLDLDNNSICDLEDTIYDRVLGHRVATWSYGPDRKPNTSDDIISWGKHAKRIDVLF